MPIKRNFLNKNISLDILFLGFFLILTFKCNSNYLGITENYYFLIISILFSILYLKKEVVKIRFENFCIIFFIYYILLQLLIVKLPLEKGVLLSYLVWSILFFILTIRKINIDEIRFLINSYIIAAIIISLNIIIVRNEFNGWIGTYRYTFKFNSGIYVDPNFMASFLLMPSILSFNKVINKVRKDKLYIQYLIAFLLISIGIVLTGSRASLVALGISCIFILIYYRSFKVLGISTILIFIILILFKDMLPYGTVKRLFFNSYIDGSNITRIDNWIHGIKAFSINPLIGYGSVSSSKILISIFGYEHAIHNTYLTFLTQLGIIGFIPVIIVIIKILIYSIKRGNRILFPIVFSLLFTSFIIEQNTTITAWITIIIIYMIIIYRYNNKDISIQDIIS